MLFHKGDRQNCDTYVRAHVSRRQQLHTMPDWKRRSATVLIGMPTVTWIFTNHVATTVTLAVLTAAATLELCTHIIPGLMRQLDRGADATPSYMQEALIRRGTRTCCCCVQTSYVCVIDMGLQLTDWLTAATVCFFREQTLLCCAPWPWFWRQRTRVMHSVRRSLCPPLLSPPPPS